MIQPAFLQANDKVALIGVAGKVKKDPILKAAKILERWQLDTILGEHIFDDHYRYSASLTYRVEEFQQFLNNPEIKAIFFARGGYGSTQLIEQIDWQSYLQSPKWLIGFSDITALLMHSIALNVMSIHGIMPVVFASSKRKESLKRLKNCLFGELNMIHTPPVDQNAMGTCHAEIIGGNLSILCSLIGTSSDVDYSHKILFIEEINEPFYKIDRMLLQMKRAYKFERLKGLIVGKFTNIQDDKENPFGKVLEEIVREYIPSDIPIAFNAPIGHENENFPVILGRKYHMHVSEKGLELH